MLRISAATKDGRRRNRDRDRSDAGRRERPGGRRSGARGRGLTATDAFPRSPASCPSTTGPILCHRVIATVEKNLVEGGLLVVAVLFAFLGNFRAGLIVASSSPVHAPGLTGMVQVESP